MRGLPRRPNAGSIAACFFQLSSKWGFLLRLQAGGAVATLARENRIAPQLIYDWRKSYLAFGTAGLNRKRERRLGWRRPPSLPPGPVFGDEDASNLGRADALARAKKHIAELERLIGRQQADLHFSRSLAAMGRNEPKRRACLYSVIQAMIIAEPRLSQG